MSLTDRLTRPTTALLFGMAALLPATVLPTATAGAVDLEPAECEEWSIDEAGNYVCGPVEEECPPHLAHCDDVAECLDPEGCKSPEPDPDPKDPDPDPPSDPGPARPVVVQPPFTG